MWSETITEWHSHEGTEESHPILTYPKWKFLKEEKIKAVVSSEIVELTDKDRLIKKCALQGFQPDPEDPKRGEIQAEHRVELFEKHDDSVCKNAPGPSKSPSVPWQEQGKDRDHPEPKIAQEGQGQLDCTRRKGGQ